MFHPKVNDDARKIAEKAIVVTGAGRSGTTILGNIIHSLDTVEYIFEPPMLISLFEVLPQLQKDCWKLLYETYLYEEFLMGSLAGRNINRNQNDDSCIDKVKDANEIAKRLEVGHRKLSLVEIAQSSVVAYKLLNLNGRIRDLKLAYPETKTVFITRNAADVIASTLKKKWFADETLKNGFVNWPFIFYKNTHIPTFVKPDDFDLWIGMDEINRCAYYYIASHEDVDVNTYIVRYEDFIADAEKIISKLSRNLGLNMSSRARELCASVGKRGACLSVENLMGKLRTDLCVRLKELRGLTTTI